MHRINASIRFNVNECRLHIYMYYIDVYNLFCKCSLCIRRLEIDCIYMYRIDARVRFNVNESRLHIYMYYIDVFNPFCECSPYIRRHKIDCIYMYRINTCVRIRIKSFLESSGCRIRPLETSGYPPRLTQ